MNHMKKLSVALLAGFILALPSVAAAHVEISPSRAPAGKPVNFTLQIGHGCDGAATRSLVVQLPASTRDVSALSTDGWKAKSAPRKLTWTGGPLPDHHEQEFPFTATLYGKKGESVLFKSIQGCEGGLETAWIESGSGSSETEHPAPSVSLTSAVAAPQGQDADDQVAEEDAEATGEPTATGADKDASSSGDEGGSGKSLLLIIVAGLAIGTIAGLVVRARRRQ